MDEGGRRETAPVRLYALDTGVIECADYAMFSPSAGPDEYREMSVRSYLVVHPEGTLLWDTGIDDEIAWLEAGLRVLPPIVFRVPRTLRHQLRELGIAPDRVDVVGLSHLHVGHVGNVGLFPQARVLLQRAEYAADDGLRAGSGLDLGRAHARENPLRPLAHLREDGAYRGRGEATRSTGLRVPEIWIADR